MKKFKLMTHNDEDVLGGAVGIDNVYIRAYGAHVSGRLVDQLDVGESCVKRYSLSGQKPTTYKIVRVE